MVHVTGHDWVQKSFENMESVLYSDFNFVHFPCIQIDFTLIQFSLFS
jgi:hypothetical protein